MADKSSLFFLFIKNVGLEMLSISLASRNETSLTLFEDGLRVSAVVLCPDVYIEV